MINKLNKQSDKYFSYITNLESYLYSDKFRPELSKRSNENLISLIDSYSKDGMISFIGAGASKPLGIFDWKELIKKLCLVANENGFTERFENFEGKPDSWSRLSQDIFDFLESKGMTSKYFDVIKKSMSPSINTTTLTLVKLILAIDFHLTTNFDVSIENAYEFLKYISTYWVKNELNINYGKCFVPDFSPFYSKKFKAVICYLHGNIEKNLYILKTKDYEIYYPSISNEEKHDASLEEFLKFCYKNKIIVFIGFSFDDFYIREFFFKLAKTIELEQQASMEFYYKSGQVYPENEIKHFLIADEEILNKKFLKNYSGAIHDFFAEFNIYLIIYKKHIFLEKLFEILSNRNLYEKD